MFTPSTAEDINTQELAIADTLSLRTTSWEQGDPARTIFAVMANVLMLADVDISLLAQGGFLDYAATGTVTYTDPVSGDTVTVYVTPDPSDPGQNPAGTLGILDVLADSVYDVRRSLASFAGGPLAIVNTSISTYGPFDAGSYHVGQPTAPGSPTYSNTATLSIPPSTIAGTAITNATNASPIVVTTSSAHGLANGDAVCVLGVNGNTAANGAWYVANKTGTTLELQGSAGNSAYTSGGAVYIPAVITGIADVAGTASDAINANVVTQSVTSLLGVHVGNLSPWIGSDTQSNVQLAATCRLKLQSLSPNGPRGAYLYFAQQAQVLAPQLTPPLAVGAAITRALVQPDLTTGTVVVTIANAAGAPSAGDVAAVDAVEQAYCVPDAVTASTQAAADRAMAVVINAWIPAAYATAIVAVAQIAVQAYFRLLAIGGITDPTESSPNTNIVPYNAVLGAVFTAAVANKIPVQQVTGTVDGGIANVQLLLSPTPEVAILSPATPTVNAIPV
jgi:2-hydroxychromene-2-carboxylate isomerase